MTLGPVLIANRGEIACRIIRSVQARGLRAIAVCSEADIGTPHTMIADDVVTIGPAPAQDSYLRIDRILDAACRSGAGAVHPGYGFLSENAEFARAVEAAGLIFVGPTSDAIEAMGNKSRAKSLMIAAGVPCIPGHEGTDQSDAALAEAARGIGFPVMIKAAAGGGGRGMRLVREASDFADALERARSEATQAFGSDELIIEKAVGGARHVEIQVLADRHGAVIHLGERDCSAQRRHQKVIEEAPCPIMTPQLRERMGEAAVRAARAVSYRGAGTVEFLLDAKGDFHFLEMNTRLQVEHPVTEMVTGLDLVSLQLAIAEGAPLPIAQEDVILAGHAIEARLYAEDPTNGFLPAAGRIDLWRPVSAPGIRIDAGIAEGQEISPHYDPMLAKIVAWGETREIARARLIRAVEGSALLGLPSNAAFLVALLGTPEFAAGEATTDLVADRFPDGLTLAPPTRAEWALAAALLCRRDQLEAHASSGYVSAMQLGWSSAPLPPAGMTMRAGGADVTLGVTCKGSIWGVAFADPKITMEVDLTHMKGAQGLATVDGKRLDLMVHTEADRVALAIGARCIDFTRLRPGAATAAIADGQITAPMPGVVRSVSARVGDKVSEGDILVVLEAMKMQHSLTAPFDGHIAEVNVSEGDQVRAGTTMIKLDKPG